MSLHDAGVLALTLLAPRRSSFLGAVGVGLTVGLKRGVLLSLLVLPLAVPLLISAACQNGRRRSSRSAAIWRCWRRS